VPRGDGVGKEGRFNGVALTQQKITNVPYLTWIYLADKNIGFPIFSLFECRPAKNGIVDVGDVSNLLSYLKYDGGAEDYLKMKQSHSVIVNDLTLSRKFLDDVKGVYQCS